MLSIPHDTLTVLNDQQKQLVKQFALRHPLDALTDPEKASQLYVWKNTVDKLK